MFMTRRTHFLPAIAAAACLSAAAASSSAQTLPPPPDGGYTAPDVVNQFAQLAHHPDPLGINIGVGRDAILCKHYQGVARYNSPDGTPYLLITKSGNTTISCPGASSEPGDFLIARMGSRTKDGLRFRSNKLSPLDNAENTGVWSSDRVVINIPLDGNGGRPALRHPGGIQVVDGYCAVVAYDNFGSGPSAELLIFDVSVLPNTPDLVQRIPIGFNGGTVAIVRRGDGYLISVGSNDSRTLYLYQTTTTNLGAANIGVNGFQPDFVWSVDGTFTPALVRASWENWQMMNFIRQDDGALFLLCADNTHFADQADDDVLKLYRVAATGSPGLSTFNLTQWHGARDLKLSNPRTGNAAAAAGAYITPNGDLIVYTTEHENNGANNSIRAGEIRSYNMSYTNNGAEDRNDAWVELYEDDNGWSESSPNRSLMLEGRDRALENWLDLDDEAGWGDAADSLRFYAPPGRQILLFHDQNLSGNFLRLIGTGQVQSISDLDAIGHGDDFHSVFMGINRVTSGADVNTSLVFLRAYCNSVGYSGERGLSFYGGSNPVIGGSIEPQAGESIILSAPAGVEAILSPL